MSEHGNFRHVKQSYRSRGKELIGQRLTAALCKYTDELLTDDEALEAIGSPYDTYKESKWVWILKRILSVLMSTSSLQENYQLPHTDTVLCIVVKISVRLFTVMRRACITSAARASRIIPSGHVSTVSVRYSHMGVPQRNPCAKALRGQQDGISCGYTA